MKKTMTFILTLCLIVMSITAYADFGEGGEVYNKHATFGNDTTVLLTVPFGEGENELNASFHASQESVVNGFTVADDGTVYVLNDMQEEPAILAFSAKGEFLYKLLCNEISQPAEKPQQYFCTIQDIQYSNGYLFAVAYYNNEQPALIKYSVADKTAEKLPFPTEFLSELDEYSEFDYMLAVDDYIVICCTSHKYLAYSLKLNSFVEESVIEYTTRLDGDKNIADIKYCNEHYTVDVSDFTDVAPIGMDTKGNLLLSAWASNPFISGYKAVTKDGKIIGSSYLQVTDCSFGRNSCKVINGSLYGCLEDSDNVYIYEINLNMEYIAKGEYDINGDGLLNTGDAVYLLKYAAEIEEYLLTPAVLKIDVNHDGAFNTADAVSILKMCAEN